MRHGAGHVPICLGGNRVVPRRANVAGPSSPTTFGGRSAGWALARVSGGKSHLTRTGTSSSPILEAAPQPNPRIYLYGESSYVTEWVD